LQIYADENIDGSANSQGIGFWRLFFMLERVSTWSASRLDAVSGRGNNVVKNVEGLSIREEEILAQLRQMLQEGLGVPVKFNLGYTSSGGLTVAFVGIIGANADRERLPFLITRNMLSEMAADEAAYRKWMDMAKRQIDEIPKKEDALRANMQKHEQNMSERRQMLSRARMQLMFDFWNVNKSGSAAQETDARNVAASYANMMMK